MALTLSQLLPLAGAVIVCTPQEVALLDAGKAIAMFEKTKVPILGIIENMSGFLCPDNGKVSTSLDGVVHAKKRSKSTYPSWVRSR